MNRLNAKTAFIIYLLVASIIFLPIFFGKISINSHLLLTFNTIFGQNLPFKDSGWDQLRWFYPYLDFTLTELKDFSLPFWNTYVFSGNTHLANFQTAVFYPLNLLGLFMPTPAYWNLLRFLPHLLGSYFTYLYLNNLKLSPKASFFGGITFGFSLLMVTWGEEIVILPHGIIWLPILLLFLDRFRQTNRRIYLGFFSLILATSIFSGFIQSTIYIVILLIFYIIYTYGVNKLTKSWKWIFLSFTSGLLITAIQILPSLELYLNSARENYNPQRLIKFLNPPDVLITYLSPDFFGNPATRNFFHPGSSAYYESVYFIGVAALIFAILSIISANKTKIEKFFIACLVIGVILSLDLFISRLQILTNTPFISSTAPNRILFIPTFSLAVLSAFGLNIYLKQKENNIKKVFAMLFAVYLAVLLVVFMNLKLKTSLDNQQIQKFQVALRNLVIPLAIFVSTVVLLLIGQRKKNLKNICIVLITLLAITNTVYYSRKFMSFSEKKFLYPTTGLIEFLRKNQGYDRTLNFSKDRIINNIFVKYQISTPEGYDPANIKNYLEFIKSYKGENVTIDRTVAEIGYPKTLENFFASDSYKKLINTLGVKYIFSEKENSDLFVGNGYPKVYEEPQDKGFAVFENPTVTPRANVIGGRGQIISYEPNKVLISTQSKKNSILILSDNYYFGWRAKLDGKDVPIQIANQTFRAVQIPSGDHRVHFYYDNSAFKTGLYLSAIGFLICIFLLASPRKQNQN